MLSHLCCIPHLCVHPCFLSPYQAANELHLPKALARLSIRADHYCSCWTDLKRLRVKKGDMVVSFFSCPFSKLSWLLVSHYYLWNTSNSSADFLYFHGIVLHKGSLIYPCLEEIICCKGKVVINDQFQPTRIYVMLSGTCMELTLLQSACTEMFRTTGRKRLLCFFRKKILQLVLLIQSHFGLAEQ